MDRRRNPQLVHAEGYLFKTRTLKNNIRYLVCKNFKTLGCTASGKIGIDNHFVSINARHNHPREDNEVESIQFKQDLKEACIRERGTLKNIYDRIATRYAVGAMDVPFNSIRSSMLRWRHATTPNIPGSLEELALVFQSGIVTANEHRAVIFGCQEFVANFADSQHAFIDGTFKAVPRRPHFMQILTIFATCMDHAFPVIHIFMERRTKALYDAVFQYIKRTFPDFVHENVITDYESALIESLRTSYPRVSLHGCFFHYCQAVLRKAKALGIIRHIEGRANGRVLLKKYYALALLPADMIIPALESLQEDAEFAEIFRGLGDYIRRQWIERVTPEHFSVFKQRHRTNNVMESYHRRLNSKLVRHPGVWDLMETLIEIQNTAVMEFAQLERNSQVFRVAKKNVVFDSRLNQAWDKLQDGRFTLGDFLRQAVHFVEGLDMQLHEWNRNIPEDEAEPLLAQLQPHHPPPVFLEPPPLVPIGLPLEPPLPLPPVINEPPALYYFAAEPLEIQHDQPLPELPMIEPLPDWFPRSPSPLSVASSPLRPPLSPPLQPMIFDFPPIPEAIGRLFAQLGNDDDDIPPFEIPVQYGWEPTAAVTEFDEETMPALLRCNICYLNRVQYCMECGHVFCTTCARTLFNSQPAKCGICRAELNREPALFYLN